MTDTGRAHCKRRLDAATSETDVLDVWGRFGLDAQADDELRSYKLRCQRKFVR